MAEENKIEIEIERDVTEAADIIEEILKDEPEIEISDSDPVKNVNDAKPQLKKGESQKDVFNSNKEYIDNRINERVDNRVRRLEEQFKKDNDERRKSELQQYDGAIEIINQRLDSAIKANNIKDYDAANKALNQLTTKKEEIEKANNNTLEETKETKSVDIKIDESGEKWANNNATFIKKINDDPDLSSTARTIAQRLLKNGYQGKPQAELMAKVKEELIRRMPEDFSEIKKDEIPNVAGGNMEIGSGNASINKKVYSLNDIPASDRLILKNHVKIGIYKDEKEAATKYFQRKLKENK